MLQVLTHHIWVLPLYPAEIRARGVKPRAAVHCISILFCVYEDNLKVFLLYDGSRDRVVLVEEAAVKAVNMKPKHSY